MWCCEDEVERGVAASSAAGPLFSFPWRCALSAVPAPPDAPPSGLLICLCAAVHHSQHSNGVLLPMHPRLPHHGDHHRHHQRWSLTSSATVHMSSRAANALSASGASSSNAAVGIREGKEEERERVRVCVSVIIVVACGGGKIEPPVPVHCVKLW